MTPARFQACLKAIGWTPWALAARLGCHETRTRRWANGRYEVPKNLARWLESIEALLEKHPPPEDWHD